MTGVVLLHGFTQTGATWDALARALAPRAVHAPDLRGHGSASELRPVSFDAVLADVLSLADEPVVLGGYSMGGRIALVLALAHPERVQRLVLVSASPGLEDPGDREARRAADEQLAAVIESAGIEQFAEQWAAQPLFAGQPAEVAALAHQDRLRNTAAGLAAALRGLGTGVMTPLWERLGELAMPVTLVVGVRDEKFRALNEAMARRIPQSRLVVVGGAGHAVHLERPDEVAAAIAT